MELIKGKVAIVTGAAAGIGAGVGRLFAAEGAHVFLVDLDGAGVKKVAAEVRAEGGSAFGFEANARDRDAMAEIVDDAVTRFGRIDVLINNAAVFQPFLIAEASDSQLLEAIATNLTGPMLCARAAIPLLNRGGHIINVSSESVGMVFPHLVVYQSSKAGLERFSEGLHHELEPSGIRVTSVRAGQMFEEGKVWNVDPAAAMAFGKATMAVGLNLRERPISQFASVTNVFRALLDLPPDIAMPTVRLQARKQG